MATRPVFKKLKTGSIKGKIIFKSVVEVCST